MLTNCIYNKESLEKFHSNYNNYHETIKLRQEIFTSLIPFEHVEHTTEEKESLRPRKKRAVIPQVQVSNQP